LDGSELLRVDCKSVIQLYGIDLGLTNPRNVRHKIRYLNKLPITYSGAVRENIDPGYRYSDNQIFDILEKLKAFQLLGF
jgi:ABC-type multidrug transport system fused ATPase/permease subunit